MQTISIQATSISHIINNTFLAHLYRPLIRIYQNLSAGHYVFEIMQNTKKISSDTTKWRMEWQSVQWVLFLCLQIDTKTPFELLSKTFQRSIDIPPYSITYNVKKAKKHLTAKIAALNALQPIIQNYAQNQFNNQ